MPGVKQSIRWLLCIFILLATGCGLAEKNTPSEVVEGFFENLKELSTLKDARWIAGDVEAAEYKPVFTNIDHLFLDKRKARITTAAFLMGGFQSYRVASVEVNGESARVGVEITGAKLLGIAAKDDEQPAKNAVAFELEKNGGRWYINNVSRW